MTRPLRIEYEGAFYHITSRGNERKRIFYSKSDYEKFKSYLRNGVEKFAFRLHSYVLMSNHYHLLIETLKANLSKILHYINTSYSNYFNIKENRIGHLFQGRYHAILIDSENYLLEVSRYLHLNPVRANVVKKPEDYPYSSYNSYLSENKKNMVFCNLILETIGGDIPGKYSIQRYKEYVEYSIGKELESPFEKVTAGIILGSKKFVSKTRQKIKQENLNKKGIANRKPLKSLIEVEDIFNTTCEYFHTEKNEILSKRNRKYKYIVIYLLKKYTDLTNERIGNLFGNLSYSAVSKGNLRFVQRLEEDSMLRKDVEEIQDKILMSNVKP